MAKKKPTNRGPKPKYGKVAKRVRKDTQNVINKINKETKKS